MDCPDWLANRLEKHGGSISFHKYMEWVLSDPKFGAYGSGKLRIGKRGDFATSPSLGPEFGELLAVQIAGWFHQIVKIIDSDKPLTLVEFGSGEGHLICDLVNSLRKLSPDFISRLEIVLVESNQGMIDRQLDFIGSKLELPVRWSTLEELAAEPVIGVMIANEVLDAFPVERIILKNHELNQQSVTLSTENGNPSIFYKESPLTSDLEDLLIEYKSNLGIEIPPNNAPNNWTTELHIELETWLAKVSRSLLMGTLLVIDYALEAERYYNISRLSGTLLAYKNQSSSDELLFEPGNYDITAHLCLETLIYEAEKSGWNLLGKVKQGQALLALGLAQRLTDLQKFQAFNLKEALNRRENLLRLVDPYLLGGFYWIAFEKNIISPNKYNDFTLSSLFLEEPSS